jgi:hypothetical protein
MHQEKDVLPGGDGVFCENGGKLVIPRDFGAKERMPTNLVEKPLERRRSCRCLDHYDDIVT